MKHKPRLDTVLRVENIIQKAEKPLSINEINNRSEKQMMRSTINTILQYLENSNKIKRTEKGVVWKTNQEVEYEVPETTEINKEQKTEETTQKSNIHSLLKELERTSEELQEANNNLKTIEK